MWGVYVKMKKLNTKIKIKELTNYSRQKYLDELNTGIVSDTIMFLAIIIIVYLIARIWY